MAKGNILIYLVRRDLRVADNPILHHLTTSSDHGYTHILPIYVFPSHQVEISGFLKDGEKSPYPPARSMVAGYWRTGPFRAKFIAESVWDLKQSLEQLNSGLLLRVGSPVEVIKHVIEAFKDKPQKIGGVYLTEEKSSEEVDEQVEVKELCDAEGVEFKLWVDEKYFIDDRDTGLEKAKDLPDVFTSYRKSQEPLRERPRAPLVRPEKAKMLPMPEAAAIPPQEHPFVVPTTLDDWKLRLVEPLKDIMTNPPDCPDDVDSAHPFQGGETRGWDRIDHLIKSGGMSSYKDTRNGLLGPSFSTKLSAYLALGCITARQIHKELLKFEDGTDEKYKEGTGFGQGENDGTRGVRFELLWRDYMRLCTMKFGKKLFRQHGFRQRVNYSKVWKSADPSSAPRSQKQPAADVARLLERFLNGTTGLGLIDASQRELFATGYTSNRARQNVASFLTKYLEIDWRYGAEWYEMLLVDYDVSSNWANWQYVAGVGNDPRGDERKFNPVKQAFDYDKEGSYVRSWVPELRPLERLECVFQPSTAKAPELAATGLTENIMVTNPVERIQFTPNRKPKSAAKQQNFRKGGGKRGGGGRGNSGRGRGGASGPDGNRSGPPPSSSHAGNTGPVYDGSDAHVAGGHQAGGRGRPARGGESAHDAIWSGVTKVRVADGSSTDGTTVQPSTFEPFHHHLPVSFGSPQAWRASQVPPLSDSGGIRQTQLPEYSGRPWEHTPPPDNHFWHDSSSRSYRERRYDSQIHSGYPNATPFTYGPASLGHVPNLFPIYGALGPYTDYDQYGPQYRPMNQLHHVYGPPPMNGYMSLAPAQGSGEILPVMNAWQSNQFVAAGYTGTTTVGDSGILSSYERLQPAPSTSFHQGRAEPYPVVTFPSPVLSECRAYPAPVTGTHPPAGLSPPSWDTDSPDSTATARLSPTGELETPNADVIPEETEPAWFSGMSNPNDYRDGAVSRASAAF